MKHSYLKYKDDVFRFALSIVKSVDAAEDITQDTFLKLFENMESIRNKEKIKFWLFSTAKNLSLNYISCEKRVTELDENESVPSSESEDYGYIELLSGLSEDDCQLISLRIIGRFKWQEIARFLNITEDAAKKRYKRLLMKIKEDLL